MNEEQIEEERTTQEAWREVGTRLEALGTSLGRAIRAVWEREDTQQYVESMQDGLQKMADEIDRAISEASESAEGKKLREEVEKAADSARVAGDQTWQNARPRLLSALMRINTELEQVIGRLEQQEKGSRKESKRTESPDDVRTP
jgi:ElaB/YqjD/DUF883 family membrane-anchored ribosome-binding protein